MANSFLLFIFFVFLFISSSFWTSPVFAFLIFFPCSTFVYIFFIFSLKQLWCFFSCIDIEIQPFPPLTVVLLCFCQQDLCAFLNLFCHFTCFVYSYINVFTLPIFIISLFLNSYLIPTFSFLCLLLYTSSRGRENIFIFRVIHCIQSHL